MVLELFGHEEELGDLELLLLDVARELDDLHAVLERRRDGVHEVGGGDEHDLGEVEGHLEVVVAEGVVLLGVEDLEQGGGGVAAEVDADLVDLVQHEDRVAGARLLEALDDPAGQGADVGAAMAADLGLVADPAQGDADELPAGGAGDGAPERGLADAGRADEAEDGALDLGVELADREELEHALLDLLEPVVILVEDALGAHDVELLLAALVPRHGDEPVEVGSDDDDLRGGGRHAFEPVDLLEGARLHLLGHLRLCDPRAKLFELAGAVVPFAQLLLDGLHLLPQVELLLGLFELLLDAGADLALHLEDLDLAVEHVGQHLQPLPLVRGLEDLLLYIDRDLGVVGDQIGETPAVGHAPGGLEGLGRDVLAEVDEPLELRDDVADEGLRLDSGLLDLRERLDVGPQEGVGVDVAVDADAAGALDHDADGAVRQGQGLHDLADGPDVVEVVGPRVVDADVALCQQRDPPVLFHGRLERLDGARAAHEQRDDQIGIDHSAPGRENGDLIWHRLGLGIDLFRGEDLCIFHVRHSVLQGFVIAIRPCAFPPLGAASLRSLCGSVLPRATRPGWPAAGGARPRP